MRDRTVWKGMARGFGLQVLLCGAVAASETVTGQAPPPPLAGAPGLVATLRADPHPLALAAADLDEDGRADVAAGYALPGYGALVLWRGLDGAVPRGLAVALPEAPELLVSADLDGDGHADVAAVARGSRRIHVALGDGAGGVAAIRALDVGSPVTSVAVGDVDRPDGLADLIAGALGAYGPELLVLEDPGGAIAAEPERLAMPREVTAIATGRRDADAFVDLFVSWQGGRLAVHGRDRRLTLEPASRVQVPAARVELLAPGEPALPGAPAADGVVAVVSARVDGDPWDDEVSLRRGVLEPGIARRAPRTTFSVTSTADAGPGTLRQAILDANASSGADTIVFAIPGAAPYVISPASALPALTEQVIVDATTQPGYATSPIVELEGSLAGAGVDGLAVAASACQVKGLVIRAFGGDGIEVTGAGGCLVEECYLGTDVAGATDQGNAGYGIHVSGSPGNLVGGTTSGLGNVISGNDLGGVGIDGAGANGNEVQNNLIGTSAAGTAAVGNGVAGVTISAGTGNVVGGSTAVERNVISGNLQLGVLVSGAASGTLVQNDVVGLTAAGLSLPNGSDGVRVTAGSHTIGGSTTALRNIVSTNQGHGIHVSGATSGSLVQGNLVGTGLAGSGDSGNALDGVLIDAGASGVTIGGGAADPGVPPGNVVSGNNNNGVSLSGVSSCLVLGNIVGLNLAGTTTIANSFDGVRVSASASNTVGGATVASRNVISGNAVNGVAIAGEGATGNLVQGNRIGTDIGGTLDRGNTGSGVSIVSATMDAVTGNTVGGDVTTPGAAPGNLISGNNGAGVSISGTGATGNLVAGNNIGLNVAGTAALANSLSGVALGAPSNTVGGDSVAQRNVISGNGQDGVRISGRAGNSVKGNYVGLNTAGGAALGNGGNGVLVTAAGGAATIGGSTTTPGTPPGNVISANASDGIEVSGGAGGCTIAGNVVGLSSATPGSDLGNTLDGILISDTTGNTVGGTTTGARNVVSGNNSDGIEIAGATSSGNAVQGNWIGLGRDGLTARNNAANGVRLNGVASHTVGGSTATRGTPPGNVISGNLLAGVRIEGAGATGNVVAGNLIGTDQGGTIARGNLDAGVSIAIGANTVGGDTAAEGNVVAGNGNGGASDAGIGIAATSSGSVVKSNLVGTNAAGTAALPNNPDGVVVLGSTSTVGPANVVSGNSDDGIQLAGSGNVVAGNRIGTDATGMADLGNAGAGVELVQASAAIVGGATASSRNVISGNEAAGVFVDDGAGASSGTLLRNNLVGTDATGTGALGNTGPGIWIQGSAFALTACTVGGLGALEPNVIAHNGMQGVRVEGALATGHRIRGNSIHANGALGIDLSNSGADGVTPNDAGDGDAGANGLQNHPVVSGAVYSPGPGTTSVTGTLSSTPSTTFDVDFYTSAVADPSGSGEGQAYRGSTVVTTDGSGAGAFAATLPGDATSVLAATATAPDGSTSEFSPVFSPAGSGPQEASPAGDMLAVKGAGTSILLTFTPAGCATDHVAYLDPGPLGPLAWTAAFCSLGISGSASFDPGEPAPGGLFAFVVVGQDGAREGSYGKSSAGAERPEATGVGSCDRPLALGTSCP